MEKQISNKKSDAGKFIPKLLLGFGVVSGVLIIIIGSTLVWLRHSYSQKRERETIEVKQFLYQVIDSIRNNTDFYKEHSAQSALRNYEELKNNADKMTGHNDIIIGDYDIGMYECKIVFANSAVFYADVSFIDGEPILHHFTLESPKWRQTGQGGEITADEQASIDKLSLRAINNVIDPEPVLVFAEFKTLNDSNDVHLLLFFEDEDTDILGIGTKETYYKDGNENVIEETYPVFIRETCPGIYSPNFKITVRNEDMCKDTQLWQNYIDGKLVNMPPIIIAMPEPNKIDVSIWVYDKAGNKSELVKVKDFVKGGNTINY